jgi:hypothetical protein
MEKSKHSRWLRILTTGTAIHSWTYITSNTVTVSWLYHPSLDFGDLLMVRTITNGQATTPRLWWRYTVANQLAHSKGAYELWPGFSGSYCWLCPFCHGALHCQVHGCMLCCPSKCHHITCTWTFLYMHQQFSGTMQDFHHNTCSDNNLIAMSTRTQSFLLHNAVIWFTQWTVLLNHRIKAY